MKINELNQIPGMEKNVKLNEAFAQFEKLLAELRKRDLPQRLVISINNDIEALNSTSISGVDRLKKIKKAQTGIIKLVEKEVKLVPKNHYRNIWMPVGMAAFGIPLGVAFGASLGNMAFLGIGIPIGLGIGVAIGFKMDKKAFDEGRQLNIEITN